MRNLFVLSIAISLLTACNHTAHTPQTALQKLQEGNERFATGKAIHPDETIERIKELKAEQHPFATVVSCSDSRVPPEIIFDQGLGDIFSIRTAGNVIGDYELGSIEYAVEHLHCKLIVVLGHKQCGAIKSFIEAKGHYKSFDHIKNIISYIQHEKEEQKLISDHHLNIEDAVVANVKHGTTLLKNAKPIIKELYHNHKIQIVGAIYDIETGKINYMNI